MNLKKELYRITDSFLTEAKNQNGEDRSLERLNEDRHLAVEEFIKLITQLLAELREEEWTVDNIPISKMEYEILGLEQIRGKVQEHNRMVEILNDKINKILNNK